LFFLVYFTPGPILRIFSKDPQLISMGNYVAKLVFLGMPLMGGVMVGQVIFQAIGKAVQAFIAAIVRPVVFLIPLVLLLPRFWQLDGVFLTLPISDLLTFLLVVGLLAPVISQFKKAAAAQKQEKAVTEPSAG
jgi:Na+-driven multidrug efflux pump